MKSKTPVFKVALTLVAASVLTMTGQAAVVVNFGETVPTTDIIASYEPATQDALTWLRTPDTSRVIAQSFLTSGGSAYSMTAISMKLNIALSQSFTNPSGFTIDFYQLSSAGQNPSLGTFIGTQVGQMQPTTSEATAGSYLTFNLDTPVTLQAGTAYGYVLAFSTVEEYNLLRLAVSAGLPDPSGTRAWISTDGSGWGNTGETYVNYIQGTAVPEPGTVALLGLGAGFALLMRRKSLAKQA